MSPNGVKKVVVLSVFLLIGPASWAVAQADSTYYFSPDVKITEAGPGDGGFPGLSSGQHYTAFRGDTVYVIWQETRSFTPPTGTWVFFAKSTDGGITFGPNKVAAGGINPSMRVDSAGIIYLAYQNSGDIFFRKSTDGGATFSSRVKANDDTIPQIGQERPAIAVNNKGQIFIAWRDQRMAPGQPHTTIFAAASYDTGRSFTPNVQVNESTSVGSLDVAADDSGRVYVLYDGSLAGIIVARSTDSGQSFGYHTLATDLPVGSAFAVGPSTAIFQEGFVGVAWQDYRFNQYTLRFSASQDYGQTFSPSVVIDRDAGAPSLVWKNGVFYVAWGARHARPPDSTLIDDVFFSYSSDSGRSFKPYVRVNNDVQPNPEAITVHGNSSVAVNEQGKAFVAWVDDRYDPFFQENWLLFGAAGRNYLVKGDVNLDWLLSATDVVLEINAAFLGQSFPAPFGNADGNCDGLLTAADVVLELNAVFLGVAFPCF